MESLYKPGDIVPFNFIPGVIIASYFVSLVGSITTIELLHRKKDGSKWYTSRWLQQLAVSVSFGLVAIWCMHYVGNRAIVLGDGNKTIQLFYNAGFTALSAVLPIIFLFIGLTAVEIRQPGQRFFWPALIVAGIIAGIAITGMHYIGNLGITNYKLNFAAGYVVGAGAIAACTSISALALFYYFQERWINSLSRRLFCACLLAGAVSGMHWVASVGTTYTLINAMPNEDVEGRDTNLIVAIVISLVACLVCLAFAFLTQRRKKQLADRAQHVVVASATFDKEGRLLVTQEGLIPCQKITKQYNQRTFNDEFNTAHPVFQWLYRITFNWSAIVDLVPAMRHHLRVVGLANDPTRPMTPSISGLSRDSENLGTDDYSILFRENFCVAASELADQLKIPLQDLGVLYNGILTTGSLSSEYTPRKKSFRMTRSVAGADIERGIINAAMLGKGQLLFLVRQAEPKEAQRLISEGFRFATINQVSDIIARSMQVPQAELVDRVTKLQKFCLRKHETLSAHVYLAAFVIRAALKASSSGWDILVPLENPTQLPMADISNEPLNSLQQRLLNRLDGLSVNQCLAYLNNTLSDVKSEEEKEWTETLLDQVSALVVDVPEQFFGHAIFSCKPIRVSGVGTYDSTMKSSSEAAQVPKIPITIYAFSVIPDIHAASIKSVNKVTYIPLSFFRASQRVYKGSPDHAILARKIHREFGTVLARTQLQHPFAFAATSTGSRRNSTDKGSSMSESLKALSLGTTTSPDRPFSQQSTRRRPMSEKFRPHFLSSIARSISPRPGSRAARSADASSETGLFDGHSSIPLSTSRAGNDPSLFNPLGGIMVSSDTTVEIQVRDDIAPANPSSSIIAVAPKQGVTIPPHINLNSNNKTSLTKGVPSAGIGGPSLAAVALGGKPSTAGGAQKVDVKDLGIFSSMGVTSEAGKGDKEEPTYVDELFRLASARFTRS